MRLHLLFTAGELPLAVAADRVARLSSPGEARAPAIAALLGRESRPGVSAGLIALEGAAGPLLADRVIGVVETTGAAAASLPALSRMALPVVQRALLLPQGVFLELEAHHLHNQKAPPPPAWPKPPAERPVVVRTRALMFRTRKRRYAVPFQQVQAVLQGPEVIEVPLTPLAHRGVLLHRGALLPVFDLPGLLGGKPEGPAAFAVLVEARGEAAALAAEEIEGAVDLEPPEDLAAAAGEGGSWLVGPAGEDVFLADCERLLLPA